MSGAKPATLETTMISPRDSTSAASAARPLLDPAHYEGTATDRVVPPPPLGRMDQALQELAQEPVLHGSIDLYARRTEVAR